MDASIPHDSFTLAFNRVPEELFSKASFYSISNYERTASPNGSAFSADDAEKLSSRRAIIEKLLCRVAGNRATAFQYFQLVTPAQNLRICAKRENEMTNLREMCE
jgi:hypothetical protein